MLEETVKSFKSLYSTKKDTIEWMLEKGTDLEKMEASIIKKVALGN